MTSDVSTIVDGADIPSVLPAGFRAGATAAGLKSNGALDLALIVNDGPSAVAAGVFTVNRMAAAPVRYSRQVIARGQARAAIINSGGANACVGPAGMRDAQATATLVAQELEIDSEEVVVASTGIIGQRLNMDAIHAGIPHAVADLAEPTSLERAATAIMTTDTVAKTASATKCGIRVSGMIKGAGMLAPEQATMICVLMTDAPISADAADRLLRRSVDATLNRIDSDGCMSTNDTTILLASGAAQLADNFSHDDAAAPASDAIESVTADLIDAVLSDLAGQLLADAEGNTHQVEITVAQATDEAGALACARTIARSALVKTAIAGNDANWGRIMSALGTVPEEVTAFDPEAITIAINGITACRASVAGAASDLEKIRDSMEASEFVTIRIELAAGDAQATVWTNDLTSEYVAINAEYN